MRKIFGAGGVFDGRQAIYGKARNFQNPNFETSESF